MNPTISIVIPNYNGAKLLSVNIPRLIKVASKESNKPQKIILVDDGSTDNSISIMESLKKKYNIDLIIRGKNGGFSSAVNSGVAQTTTQLVMLLNSDAYPERGFIDNAIDQFKNGRVFGVGLMDKSIEGKIITTRGRGIGYWDKGLVQHKRGEVNKSDTFWLSGGSSIFRKDLWDKFEGMDKIFNPFYWEDIDLSYRARKAGYMLMFENRSIVTHIHSEGAIKQSFSEQKVKQIAFRNQLLFIWKNITSTSLMIKHILWLPIHIFKPLVSGETVYMKGFFGAIKLLSGTLKSRRRQKPLNIVSDEALISLRSET